VERALIRAFTPVFAGYGARDTHHLSASTAVAMGIGMRALAPSCLHPSYKIFTAA
jgi:hypothetical protein